MKKVKQAHGRLLINRMEKNDFLFKRDYIRQKMKDLQQNLKKTNVPKPPESSISKRISIQKRYNSEDKKATGG